MYGDGRSRTVYVPQALAAVASEHVEATRRGEALMAEISQVNLELLRRQGAAVMGGGGHRRRGGLVVANMLGAALGAEADGELAAEDRKLSTWSGWR